VSATSVMPFPITPYGS